MPSIWVGFWTQNSLNKGPLSSDFPDGLLMHMLKKIFFVRPCSRLLQTNEIFDLVPGCLSPKRQRRGVWFLGPGSFCTTLTTQKT